MSLRDGKHKKIPLHLVGSNGTREDHIFESSYIPKFTTSQKFIEDKVKMLRDHFRIDVTYEDIMHLREYKTENEINAAVRGIINKYWE